MFPKLTRPDKGGRATFLGTPVNDEQGFMGSSLIVFETVLIDLNTGINLILS